MVRQTKPREWKAALSRIVIVSYRQPADKIPLSLSVKPRDVEDAVARLIAQKGTIVSVDGKRPPNGSDGRCSFDTAGAGPYWASDL